MIDVLYVDDERDLLDLVKGFLERSGEFRVTTTTSVTEAEAALADSHFDIVLSDHQPDGTGGLAFLRTIRATDKDIPFVLFTGQDGVEEIIEAYDLGASFTVRKGSDPRSHLVELGQKILRAVERSKAGEGLRKSEERLHTLVDRSPLAIAFLREGKIIHVNPAYGKLLGYRNTDELVGEPWAGFIDPEYLHLMKERADRQEKGLEVSPTYESLMVMADGARVPVLVADTEIVRADGSYTITFLTDLTERKRVEDELRASREELESFFRLSLDLLAIADVDGYFRRINPEWEVTLGYRAEDILKHKFYDLVHPDDLEATKQAVRDLSQQKDLLSFTNRYRRKDGSYRWIEWRSHPEGKLVYAAARDITDRKRVEEELTESQEDLALAQTVSRTGSWRLNVSTDELRWSDEVYRIFGVPKGEPMTFGSFIERIHPEDRAYVTQKWQEALAGEPYDIEHRVIVDGEIKWVREKAVLEFEGKQLKSGFGTVQDITELKDALDALQRSEQMLKIVLDHFPGVVYWKDRSSVYLGANREAARVAGFADPSEYLGKTDYDMPWGRTEAGAYRADDRQVMESGQPKLHVIERQLRAGGQIGWLDTSKVPLRDPEGNVIGILGTSTDITERKQAEDALLQANKQLNLLNGVTRHDMLNQLMALSGYTDLLETSGLTQRQVDLLQRIRTSINMLGSQLEFTKMYQEIGMRSPKWQNLHALVQESKENLVLGNLMVKEEGTDVWILADPMLEKVVYNLIENVLRHSGGARLLRIVAMVREGRLTAVFEDDGRGIAEEDKKHLFERGHGKNTGFGLFLSREILGITNMSIRETSAPGKGARFEIEVPQETMFKIHRGASADGGGA